MPSRSSKPDESVHWPVCSKCGHKHRPDADCPQRRDFGVVWLIRPMPDGQWPPDECAPRDDSFSWLVRSHCGHIGKLWAFYEKADAQQYEGIFRAAPCHYTRCQDRKRRRR